MEGAIFVCKNQMIKQLSGLPSYGFYKIVEPRIEKRN